MDVNIRGGEVATALQSAGLGQYATSLIKELGFDDINQLRDMTDISLQELADETAMKPGHKLRFVKAFSSTPQLVASQTTLQASNTPKENATVELQVIHRTQSLPTGGVDITEHCIRALRADFQLSIGADICSSTNCCYLVDESLKNGWLPPYDPKDWGGRISSAEYDQLRLELQPAYVGDFNSDVCAATLFGGCLCICCAYIEVKCIRDNKIKKILDAFNEKMRKQGRGVTLSLGARLTINGSPVAHKLVVKIVPI